MFILFFKIIFDDNDCIISPLVLLRGIRTDARLSQARVLRCSNTGITAGYFGIKFRFVGRLIGPRVVNI